MKVEYIIIDIETNGMSALANRITAICCKTHYGGVEMSFVNQDEKSLLYNFWNWIDQINRNHNGVCFVGYNVYAFDLKFLHIRSMKFDLEVPVFSKDNYIDLRYELLYYERFAKGSLGDYAGFIGMPGKNGDGLKAIVLWDEARIDELIKYCMNDVAITHALFERCIRSKIIKELKK
jgi:predicted PolB exonuclease-like 3'-5' exonuclease